MEPSSRDDRRHSCEAGLSCRRKILAAIAVAAVLSLAIAACRQFLSQNPTVDSQSTHEAARWNPTSLPLPQSPYLNTAADATYVGTKVCQECHLDEHASYLQTRHSKSFGPVEASLEPPDGSYVHSASNLEYEVYREDGKLKHRESLQIPGSKPIEMNDCAVRYLVGSGRFARTYLVEFGDFLVESPLTWYTSVGQWRMSPGYDGPRHHSFQRTVGEDCLFCHTGGTRQGNDELPRIVFREFAISCERCHGPGSLHAERHRNQTESLGSANDLTIVNPKNLSRELSEAICQQCHLESVVRSNVQGRTPHDFRPGLRWTDFCINYDAQLPSDQMTVTGHVQQMHQSNCYRKSNTLTCITCHRMHELLPESMRIEQYRAACLSCHEEQSCSLPHNKRRERGDNCTACHMPQSPTEVPHVAFTHHRIGLHAAAPEISADELAAVPLAPILDLQHLPQAHRDRNLGLAYLQQYVNAWQDSRFSAYRDNADKLLASAMDQGVVDPAVLTARALIENSRGDWDATLRYSTHAKALGELSQEEAATVRDLLATSYFNKNQFNAAERQLDRQVQSRRDVRDWILLGRCRERQNNLAGAIEALEVVLSIDPRMPETYLILADLHRRLGNYERSQAYADRAAQIDVGIGNKSAP